MDNTVCKQEDVCYNKKNGMIDVCSIEEIRERLIRMFEALPDCVAAVYYNVKVHVLHQLSFIL